MPQIPLPPITDFEAYNKNTKDQYEALGRFVVAFEAMVGEVRTCSINLLDREHLIDIPFHHPALTAKPLFEIFRALVIENLRLKDITTTTKEKDSFRGVLKTIATEFSDLVNIRNTLLHGTWQIGYSTTEDPNSANFFLYKYKPTSGGLEKQEVPKHAFELLALKDRCEDTRTWIGAIHFCVPRQDRPYDKIEDRFSFLKDKWHLTIASISVGETLPRKSPEQSGEPASG